MVTIPGPRENDADNVSLALEVAQSQWARGDRNEALKWLKKAVDAAFEADDDQRGMDLSKVAAEVKAEADKPAKPQMPPPKPASMHRPSAPPQRPSAPPVRKPPPPPTTKPQTPQAKPAQPKTTGMARSSGPLRDRGQSAVHAKPPMDDEEATREYNLDDMGAEVEDVVPGNKTVEHATANVVDEWPTEAVDDISELEDVAEPAPAKPKAPSRSSKPKNKKREPVKPERKVSPGKGKRQDPASVVPTTRAVRVAVGKDKSTTYVRLLDANGLREGEQDAMIVALTGEDIREMFK